MDTAIEDGYFNLELPVTAQAGIYRLVYAVPQDEFYIDVIYNKKEGLEFNFDMENGINFIKSEENILFTNYFDNIRVVENKLLGLYANRSISKSEFEKISKELKDTQERFEAFAPEPIAHPFIQANRAYVPDSFESVEIFIKSKNHTFLEGGF